MSERINMADCLDNSAGVARSMGAKNVQPLFCAMMSNLHVFSG
jgi:hypothetical protein